MIMAVVIILPIAGYSIAYGLTLVAPMGASSTFYHLFYTVLVIAIGLGVPYWMLKLVSRVAHGVNTEEKEMQLDDIPKDKDQMKNTLPHHS